MLNDRADPPVEIRWDPTNKLSRYSRNVYIDPTDQEEWDPDDMSPLEKGHVYWYRQDGDLYRIHSPYRIVDKETGYVLQKLRSFWALDPAVLKSKNESARRNPCNALRHFTLSTKDFRTFSQQGGKLGWTVEKDEVDVPVLLGNISEVADLLSSTRARLETYRVRWGMPPGPSSEELLWEATEEANQYRQFVGEIHTKRLILARQLDRLSREAGRRSEYVVVEGELERLGNALDGFNSIPLDRYEREAIHLFRVSQGIEAAGSAGHLRTLTAELNDLRPYHPALRGLKTEGEELVLQIDTLKIRITPERVVVEGDPAVLRPYLGAGTLEAAPVASNRFRAIVAAPPSDPE
jgi:hypothetical protein